MATAYAPGTELLVRFPTRAHKRLGDPGNLYMSRQGTNLAVGTVLEVVEDNGYGYLFARQGKNVFQVHNTDLMPKPDYAQVAHQAVQGLIKENLLTDTEGALKLVEAKNVDLTLALAEATEANRRLQAEIDALKAQKARWEAEGRDYETILDERDQAREAAGVTNQARLEAEKWLASARRERDEAIAERDTQRAKVKTLNSHIRKAIGELNGLPEWA